MSNSWVVYFPSNAGILFTLSERNACLLYTSDAADESEGVDLGGRRIIKKKKKKKCQILE